MKYSIFIYLNEIIRCEKTNKKDFGFGSGSGSKFNCAARVGSDDLGSDLYFSPPVCRLSPPKTIISYLNDQASAASSRKYIILARLSILMW